MKLLLLLIVPLLAAISGCSNNLSYKTEEGKKILIREDTVQIQKILRDDFREMYKAKFYDDTKSKETQAFLLKYSYMSPRVHANYISFTAIARDSSNKKIIMPRIENAICFNPKLGKKFRAAWELELDKNTFPPDNICKHFVKF